MQDALDIFEVFDSDETVSQYGDALLMSKLGIIDANCPFFCKFDLSTEGVAA